MSDNLQQILAKCIEKSIDPGTKEFQWDKFFPKWFRKNGKSFFFLFKKNLGVTNTQYVELFSLTKEYCQLADSEIKANPLLFYSTDQMKKFMVDTLNTLLDVSSEDFKDRIKGFTEKYINVFKSVIVVDMFYCSCALFLPPGLSLDIERVCAESGYIHSAGNSIFIRNIDKAKLADFENNLRDHLKNKVEKSKFPLPFIVYAHEDFTLYDRDFVDELKHGIDEVKMHLEKMMMSNNKLATIIEAFRGTFEEQLLIPISGSYKDTHDFVSDRSIFLITDKAISTSKPATPAADSYYICYEQTVKNENPFFFFDENKPAWKSHTTMPHSLTSALINSARPFPANAVICDPFGGTGTTWFEAKRLNLEAHVECSDISPVTQILVKDNFAFFRQDITALEGFYENLQEINREIKRKDGSGKQEDSQALLPFGDKPNNFNILLPYYEAKEMLDDLMHEQRNQRQEYEINGNILSKLKTSSLLTRLLFYVGLRAELRYEVALNRKTMDIRGAFLESSEELLNQVEHFIEVRKLLDLSAIDKSSIVLKNNYLRIKGKYSTITVPIFFAPLSEGTLDIESEVFVRDATDLKPNSLDLIICDPPYGFNTTEDQVKLARLYSEFIEAAVLALKDSGHLIMCLPEQSYTGRALPYCTNSNLITSQVLTLAAKYNKHVFRPATMTPSSLFSPPYYWVAEKALRRKILHFRIGWERDSITDVGQGGEEKK